MHQPFVPQFIASPTFVDVAARGSRDERVESAATADRREIVVSVNLGARLPVVDGANGTAPL